MEMSNYLFFLFLTFLKYFVKHVVCSGQTQEWSYVNISAWEHDFPGCKGDKQSPVNIIDNEAITLTNSVELYFDKYNTSFDAMLENNGKTVKLSATSPSNLTVSGLGMYLENTFTLVQVHFHWGSSIDSGSEHRINGMTSSMEVHFVHFNLEKYPDINTAMDKSDGVLVLAVLVQASRNGSLHGVWKDITDDLASIIQPGSKTVFPNLRLQSLLPKNVRDFYFYRGSFTTPSCLQSVTWVVFKEKLLVPLEYVGEFQKLRTIIDKSQERLSSNTRPVQPLNSREILKTFKSPNDKKELFTTEKNVGGHGVITVVRFHPCQVPLSVDVSIIVPSLDINWKGSNIISDIPDVEVLDSKQSYAFTLEKHDHPEGRYKNMLHVTVRVTDSPGHKTVPVVSHYFKKCVVDSCKWLTSENRTCTRRLTTSGHLLSFTLSIENACSDLYKLVVNSDSNVIFSTTLVEGKPVRMEPRNVDQILNASLIEWKFVLHVDKSSNINDAKLFVEIVNAKQKVFVMEGKFGDVPKCGGSGDNPHHVKFIVGVTIGVFILAMILLTTCLLYKRYNKRPAQNMLVIETEEDTVV